MSIDTDILLKRKYAYKILKVSYRVLNVIISISYNIIIGPLGDVAHKLHEQLNIRFKDVIAPYVDRQENATFDPTYLLATALDPLRLNLLNGTAIIFCTLVANYSCIFLA